MSSRLVLVVAVVVLIGSASIVQSGSVYWSEIEPASEVWFHRADLDGNGAQALSGIGIYFTLDLTNGKRYWHDNQTGGLMRSNLDGSDVEQLYGESIVASDLALDLPAAKVYAGLLADEGCGFIFVRNLDGSGQEVLVNNTRPIGVSLDLDAGKIYWADQCDTNIKRSNLDGTGVETLLSVPSVVLDLTLDPDAGKIYWARSDQGAGDGAIERSNLDGTAVETVVSASFIQGVALDPIHGKLYWSEGFTTDVIRRSDLDGSNVELVLSDVDALRLEIDPFGDVPDIPAVGGPAAAALALIALALSSLALARRRH